MPNAYLPIPRPSLAASVGVHNSSQYFTKPEHIGARIAFTTYYTMYWLAASLCYTTLLALRSALIQLACNITLAHTYALDTPAMFFLCNLAKVYQVYRLTSCGR